MDAYRRNQGIIRYKPQTPGPERPRAAPRHAPIVQIELALGVESAGIAPANLAIFRVFGRSDQSSLSNCAQQHRMAMRDNRRPSSVPVGPTREL